MFSLFTYPYSNITFPNPVLDFSLMAEHDLRQLICNLEMAGLARLEVRANEISICDFLFLFPKKVINTSLILLTL